jgi:hypothetical protein
VQLDTDARSVADPIVSSGDRRMMKPVVHARADAGLRHA